MRTLTLFGLCCVSLVASSIIVGAPPDRGGNGIPFGSPAVIRYQQAYADTDFDGPILITEVNFFRGPIGALPSVSLYTATYQLSFSTISKDIDSLSDTDLNANLGSDNTLFTTVPLSGGAPVMLSFSGTPFLYDPSRGNLLLDIHIIGGITNPDAVYASFLGRTGTAAGIFSRYTNPANTSIGWGLVTQFDTAVPEPSSLALTSIGLVIVVALGGRKTDYFDGFDSNLAKRQ